MDNAIKKLATMYDGYGIALYSFIVVIAAMILSGIIGYEREKKGFAAGLRTHILVGIGSCLFMIVSIYAFPGNNADPGRIAAQVVTGIGFLGAGTIMQTGLSIKGLTTAATLWVCAAIGLCSGAGLILEATIVSIICLLVLILLKFFEDKTDKNKIRISYIVPEEQYSLSDAIKVLDEMDIQLKDVDLHRIKKNGQVLMNVIITLKNKDDNIDSIKVIDSLNAKIKPIDIVKL